MKNKITTYNESSLHSQLKEWLKKPGDELEKEVGGFVIDLVRGEQLIEIQTANFAAIKRKLIKLLPHYKIRLVYPVAQIKWICNYDEQDNFISRKKSPKKGKPLDIFSEIVRIPELLDDHNFSIELLMVELEEIRRKDGKGSWRRKGVSIADRRLVNTLDSILIQEPYDLIRFLPEKISEPFTARSLARSMKVRITESRKIAYSFRKMGLFRLVGKRGGSYLYRKISSNIQEGDHYNNLLARIGSGAQVIGKENYFHSVVFVPFVEIDDEQYLLYQKRSENIRQPGEICFPGGGIDLFKDNSIVDTAVRETIEELGLPREKIEVGVNFGALINSLGTLVEVIIGRLNIKGLEELILNEKEVSRVFLIPVKFLKENPPDEFSLKTEVHSIINNENGEEVELFPAQKLGIPSRYWRSWSGRSRKVYVYKYDGEIIWGITAEITQSLMKML